ncbi:EndoU domain-containing protein [Fortiea sp. LEGE XX443]|uniref:EndoU domain-containing protein n=1 Tax=Fortiea sp. LEGE XX443 TaxID=1828611 RepID=UPI0018827F4D|nr:EndoU domain-containing protein [Fortiea sp. LEGE XX443]MBE9008116.1 EndoU domain-containing protein [Fortiea sp. LEGE XX443]
MSKLAFPLKVSAGTFILLTFCVTSANSATITEGFEFGTKASYAAADVNLSTGLWNLNDALIGDLSTDRKSGLRSARIRNSGRVSMRFDRTTGAGSITIKHAKFGTDANTTWGVWCSTNSGSSYIQVGSTVNTTSTTLQTATFTANISGSVRCEIRKTDATANRINIDDIVINDYGSSGSGSTSLPSGSVPFFDDINNPVSGLAFGSPADVTPTAPGLNSFDTAVVNLCGAPGTVVSRTGFQTMMNNNPTVLTNIKTYVGGYLKIGRTSNTDFLNDLTDVWFNVEGFEHVFCGEPVQGGSIGGLHFVGRYVELQNKGLAGRLSNNTFREEVVPNTIYTMGVVMRVGTGTAQSTIKGYPYTLNAEEMLSVASLGYKNNPNTSTTNQACLLSVTDENRTFKAVFVRRQGGVRTFYPDATPDSTVNCSQ